MSLIDQAAKRLEELRRAGAALPEAAPPKVAAEAIAPVRTEHVPTRAPCSRSASSPPANGTEPPRWPTTPACWQRCAAGRWAT